MSEILLEARNLKKTFRIPKTIFGRKTVVSGVSFRVESGEVIGLLGPNGAGKTTSFRMAMGLLTPDEGEVRLRGEDVTKLPMYRRAALGMGYLPQQSSVFRRLTVEENLLAILERVERSRDAVRSRLEDLLRRFGLQGIRTSRADTVSGGERRRLEIARALVTRPRVILLDEPFAGIDPITVGEIQSLVAELADDGIGILITDHNVRETLATTDRAYIIEAGRILTEGTPEGIVQNDAARRAYLGDGFHLDPGERRRKRREAEAVAPPAPGVGRVERNGADGAKPAPGIGRLEKNGADGANP